MSTDERLARVVMSRAIEPGHRTRLARLREVGATAYAQEVLVRAGRDADAQVFAERLREVDPRWELEWAAEHGIRFVIPGDDEWPAALDDLAEVVDASGRGGVPAGLWLRGPWRLDGLGGSVAVVGSRAATTYGAQIAGDLAGDLAEAGRVVVSGAASGIDYAAHRGAVAAGGPTVAVLACGVDRPYPLPHRGMLEHLAATALVISETAPRHSATKARFLSRNRLIAALTGGTVVVEAAARSGALSTARWADALSRRVMGVPGPVTSATSQGVHHLIRSGAATVVATGRDVLEVMGESGEHLLTEPRGPDRPGDEVTEVEQQVLEALPSQRGASLTSLARRAGLTETATEAALLVLRERGLAIGAEAGWRISARARGGDDPDTRAVS